MELNNRITLYMAVLIVLAIILLPCANAQSSGRNSRGGTGGMMGGGMRGGGDRGERGDRGGGRGGPGRGGMSFRDEELSESQIDRIMKDFSFVNSTKAEELKELRKTNKEKFLYELRANAFLFVAQEMREAREYRDTLEWCEKFVADEAKGIRELKEENYELYKKRLDTLRDKYRLLIYQQMSDELMHISVRDYQLQLKLMDLSMEYWNSMTTPEKKESLLSEIEDVHSEQYDQDIKRTQINLQEIEKEIDRLQARLDAEKKQVEEAEKSEAKEEEIRKIMEFYKQPMPPSFRRSRRFGRPPMIPSILQVPDHNSIPAP